MERVDRLGLLDLRDHVRGRSGLLDQVLEVAYIRGRADERERDEVDVERERELEIVHVLPGQRWNRDRDSRKVDSLVRADDAAGEHGALGATPLDALDT